MVRHDRRVQVLAASLSAVAGFVDALGFLALGGFFVSFMSGNSTRLGVGIARSSINGEIAAGLISTFVCGVVLGSLVGHFARQRRRSAVLLFVAIALGAAATFSALGASVLAIGAMTLAMGAENAVFERDGEVSIGLTYMTGTLVKAGQRISVAILGGEPFAWVPYLMLWAGLVAGAVAGAATYARIGLLGLWFAAAATAVLSLLAGRLGLDERNVT